MHSKFSTFLDMGMSNKSDLFLSDKDLESMELNFLVKPTLEFPDGSHIVAHSEDHGYYHPHQDQEVQKHVQEEERKENCGIATSSLEIKIPSLDEFKNDDDEEEDGFRTPTSLDQRIPLILTCPPAPRKPKSLPSTKRKAPDHHRKILLHLSNEIQSLFPAPALIEDLGGNKKIKKARDQVYCTK